MSSNEDSEQVDVAGAGEVADRNIWAIMVGMFTGPTEAFAAFSRRPRIWMVLIVAILLGLINNGVMTPYSAKMQYELLSKSTVVPPQILEQSRQQIENPDYIKGAASAVVGQIVIGLIFALIAWGVGIFIMGGSSTFKKVWGATLLGGLIYLVGALIKLPLIVAKESMYVSFGLAALFPDKDLTSILYGILFYFDAFMIWGMIVTGIGYATIFNISRARGMTISVALSLLGVIFMIGATAFGMSFVGVEITFF